MNRLLLGLFCLMMLMLGASQCALATKLWDQLDKIKQSVKMNSHSMIETVNRLQDKENLAWQTQMNLAQQALERKDYESAENALHVALGHAKLLSDDTKLQQTRQVTSLCYKQHAEAIRAALPLSLIPSEVYHTLVPIAYQGRDFIIALGIAAGVITIVICLVVFAGVGDSIFLYFEGLKTAIKAGGIKISLAVAIIVLLLGVSCWVFSSINQAEELEKNATDIK